jgi:hypothetical protein
MLCALDAEQIFAGLPPKVTPAGANDGKLYG